MARRNKGRYSDEERAELRTGIINKGDVRYFSKDVLDRVNAARDERIRQEQLNNAARTPDTFSQKFPVDKSPIDRFRRRHGEAIRRPGFSLGERAQSFLTSNPEASQVQQRISSINDRLERINARREKREVVNPISKKRKKLMGRARRFQEYLNQQASF